MTLMRELTEENEDNQGPFPECSYPFFSLAAFCRSFHLRSSATSICAVAGLLLSASTPATFAKGQKKSTASAQQKPEAILSAAKKFADAKAWGVQAHVNADKDMKISGIIVGKDFDLTVETLDGTTRQIGLADKSWSSDDGGKTWKENKEIDRRFYYLMHTPIKYSADEKIPPFAAVGTEKLGDESILHIRFIAPDKITYEGDRANYWIAMQDPKSPVIHRFLGPMGFENNYVTERVHYTLNTEQRGGQTWLHIRLKVAEAKADPKELPQYWLVLDSQGQAQYIGRAEMPMVTRGTTTVTQCSFDYAPAKEKIAPPPLGAPVDDKVHGFNDIEQHKFDWKGRVVRLEVTPKVLQSEQIGEDTYRAFLKDTATPNHYGVVEFPHDALVKLGFLKKTVSGTHAWEDLEKMGALGRTEGEPVSFYVQVIPIGEKPAARALAVGARLVRDPDGSVSYTWESDEKQTAKSPPAPAAPDASDGDLVNRGIEKAKYGDLDGAIADFDRAIELNPKDDAPYYNRAQAKRLKKDTAGAIADYTRAIELGSTNPAAYNYRGNARSENN